MRQIRAATFVSMDGVMQAPGGPEEDPTGGFRFGGWNFPYWDEKLGGLMGRAMGEDYDLLLGRRTKAEMAAAAAGVAGVAGVAAAVAVTKRRRGVKAETAGEAAPAPAADAALRPPRKPRAGTTLAEAEPASAAASAVRARSATLGAAPDPSADGPAEVATHPMPDPAAEPPR